MHVFRNVCIVHNLYGDRLALAHPQQGTGDFIVAIFAQPLEKD
jgi:hypothetical protein